MSKIIAVVPNISEGTDQAFINDLEAQQCFQYVLHGDDAMHAAVFIHDLHDMCTIV